MSEPEEHQSAERQSFLELTRSDMAAIAALVSSTAAVWSNGKLLILRVSSRNDCRSAD
jgi:hypothetical protein